jgi:hypothetical protein
VQSLDDVKLGLELLLAEAPLEPERERGPRPLDDVETAELLAQTLAAGQAVPPPLARLLVRLAQRVRFYEQGLAALDQLATATATESESDAPLGHRVTTQRSSRFMVA